MLRYSDILLIYAEAANLAEGSPSQKAYDALNEVRRRAGLPELSGLTAKQFDDAVLDERNWELAFECNRWFDLCRNNKVEQYLNGIDNRDSGRIRQVRQFDGNSYLLPIPQTALDQNTNLEQNPGY